MNQQQKVSVHPVFFFFLRSLKTKRLASRQYIKNAMYRVVNGRQYVSANENQLFS